MRVRLIRLFLLTMIVSATVCAQDLKSLNRSLTDLTSRLSGSVVQVSTNGFGPTPDAPASHVKEQQGRAAGVIVAAEGFILTNAHVVNGANRITVQIPSKRNDQGSIIPPMGRIFPAKVVGVDRETDLALLKIEAPNLTPLPLGDSDNVRQGQIALALGSPLGLDNSVSLGVVSAIARQLEPDNPVVYIQTDASINPGNSGGPLVDTDGNVIGINTMILTQSGGSEGVGFAIPSNIVRNVYEQLRKSGKVTRGEIGIEAQTITPGLATALKLPRAEGVVLADVVPGHPADTAGLQTGDIVLSLDGKPMENARQLMVNLYSKPINGLADIQVLRGTQTLNKRVVILEREDDPSRFASLVRSESHSIGKLGILGLALDSQIAAKLPGLRKTHGIIVAALVGDNSPLELGDVIYALNGQDISTLKDIRDFLDAAGASQPVVLQIERAGRLRYIEFPME